MNCKKFYILLPGLLPMTDIAYFHSTIWPKLMGPWAKRTSEGLALKGFPTAPADAKWKFLKKDNEFGDDKKNDNDDVK